MKKHLGISLVLVALTGALASCGGNTVTNDAYLESNYDNWIYKASVTARSGILTDVTYDAVQKVSGWARVDKEKADADGVNIPVIEIHNDENGDGVNETIYIASKISLLAQNNAGEDVWYTYNGTENESYYSSHEYVDYTSELTTAPSGENTLHSYLNLATTYPARGQWYFNLIMNGNYHVLDNGGKNVDSKYLITVDGALEKNSDSYTGSDKESWASNKATMKDWFITKWNKVYPMTGEGRKARFRNKNGVNSVHLEWDEIVVTQDGGTTKQTQSTEDVEAPGISWATTTFQDIYKVTWAGYSAGELSSYSFF